MAGKIIFVEIQEDNFSSKTPITMSLSLPKYHKFVSSGYKKVPYEYGEILGLYFVVDTSCEETIDVEYLLVKTNVEFPSQALYRYVCSIHDAHIFEILPDYQPLEEEEITPTHSFEEYEDDDEEL